MDLPEWMTPHQVGLRPYLGSGAGGQPVHGPAVLSRANVQPGKQQVRDAKGARVLSTAAVFLPLDAPELAPESLVDLPDGSSRAVIVVDRHEHDDATPNHVEVRLR